MHLSVEQAIKRLCLTVKNEVVHEDYERVTHLAREYKKLITGEGIATMLRQVIRREDKEAFKQRLEITETVLPAISEKIMSPFNKVGRMDNVTKTIEFVGDTDSRKIRELNTVLGSFWGDQNLDAYMDTRFIELSFVDPNAFLLVEFDSFDADKEKAQPYPVEVASKDVLDYEYENNTLKWVLFRRQYLREVKDNYTKETKWVEDYKYYLYLENYQVEIIQLDRLAVAEYKEIPLLENGDVALNTFTYGIDKDHQYLVNIYNQNSDMVQGIRVGYKRDLVTDGRTCVSPFQPAVNRMKKTLKTGSEFDLTMTLHAFPQKSQYVKRCDGEDNVRCKNGYRDDGAMCGSCKGSGYQIQTSAQDIVLLPIPKDPTMMHDLSKLTHYSGPDIQLAEFQEGYLRRLEADAIKDVFSSDTFNRDTVANTATEVVVEMQSVYDTLFPFAQKFSMVYEKMVSLSAVFTDNLDGLMVIHRFPKDFKLKSLDALLRDLKSAVESGAPSFVRNEISNDIAEKIWTDNPDRFARHMVKQEHLPFAGKTHEEIIYIQAQGNASEKDIILWSNFDSIVREIELQYEEMGKDFYLLPYPVRQKLIDDKVEEFKVRINGETFTAVTFGGESGSEIETPIDIEAEAKAKLKGTVGGVQAIIDINIAVANNQMSEKVAERLIQEIFGFEKDVASAMVDKQVTPPTA